MASSYSISAGSGRVLIDNSNNTFSASQIVHTSLDDNVTVKLQQTSDGVNFKDISGTSATLTSTDGSVLLETFDFVLTDLYLYVDVGVATTGTLEVFKSPKKKEDNNSVTATISGTTNVDITNDKLKTEEDLNGVFFNLLDKLLKEQKETNRLLNKILN